MIKVENMKSDRSWREVPNQFVITTDKGCYFKSYSTVIAFNERGTGKVTLSEKWDYSKTTGKYRNQFLGESKAGTQKKIDSGKYLVVGSIDVE